MWKRWPQGSFRAACMESQQMAQSSLLTASSSGVATANLRTTECARRNQFHSVHHAPLYGQEVSCSSRERRQELFHQHSYRGPSNKLPSKIVHLLSFMAYQRASEGFIGRNSVLTMTPVSDDFRKHFWAKRSEDPQRAKQSPRAQRGSPLISHF